MQNNNMKSDKNIPVCFLHWTDCRNAGELQIGGKAWHLSRLHQYGFNVPNGGVIPVSVFEQFIRDNQLHSQIRAIGKKITLENIDQATSLLNALRKAILNSEFSPVLIERIQAELQATGLDTIAVAVRSSATSEDSTNASFAGIHQSFLNVLGQDKIFDSIKRCFCSLWTLQAVAYRRKKGIEDQAVLPAVIIMEMIHADVAGVGFSCDPVNGRQDIYLVNANFGLGESVVEGVVDPDSYFINKFNFQTTHSVMGAKKTQSVSLSFGGTENKPRDVKNRYALNENQQFRLGLLIQRIFDGLGHSEQHQDIEWAFKNDELYVLQARPVTVLPQYTCNSMPDKNEVWSNANFRDAVPMVQTLLQRYSIEHSVNTIMLTPFINIGYSIPQGLSLIKYIQGRAYINASLYQWLLFDAIGVSPEDVNLLMGGHQPAISVPPASPYKGIIGLKRILRLIKNIRYTTKHNRNKRKLFGMVMQHYNDIYNRDFRVLSNEALYAEIIASGSISDRYGFAYMSLSSGTGSLLLAIKMLDKYFPHEGVAMVNALSMGRGSITSADHGYALQELAQIAHNDTEAKQFLMQADIHGDKWQELSDSSEFKQAFMNYLAEFGHRAVYEVDMTSPRWRENPSYLLKNIAAAMQQNDMKGIRQRQEQRFIEAQSKLKNKLGFIPEKVLNKLIQKGIEGSETREQAKSIFVRFACIGRILFLEVGRRLVEKGILLDKSDIFHCGPAEIFSILLGYDQGLGLKQLIIERKQRHESLGQKSVPDLVVNDRYEFKRAEPVNGNTYRGMAVSAGIAEGIVKKISNPDEGNTLQPGDVLVAPSTDPAWTPLFLNASAIILETGGYTSHGSIVAREYGIPALANIAGAMSIFNNGDKVTVNGNTGELTLHD